MATNNRGVSRGGNRGRRGRNNNPEGRNQYSGVTGTARANPITTAAAIGGAVAAGVFLWSRRNQLSDQIGSLAETITEWREGIESEGGGRTQAEIAEEALTLKQIGETA